MSVAFVFKMNAAGDLIWSKMEAHPVDVFMDKIMALNANEYWVACGYLLTNGVNLDVVVAKLDATTGNLIGLSARIQTSLIERSAQGSANSVGGG